MSFLLIENLEYLIYYQDQTCYIHMKKYEEEVEKAKASKQKEEPDKEPEKPVKKRTRTVKPK